MKQKAQPIPYQPETNVARVQRRLLKGQCVDCGMGNMPINKESGFLEHRCVADKKAHEAALLREARTRKGESDHARVKRLKREGIENLDRILGVEP